MDLISRLEELEEKASALIFSAQTQEELENLRVRFLGRKGEVTFILRQVGQLSSEEKPLVGAKANKVRNYLESLIESRSQELKQVFLREKIKKESVDITLPGRIPKRGRKHLITQVIEEIVDIFLSLGYRVAEGPEIETDYYNFTALNMPPHHPARSLWDTLYLESSAEEILLRTHTSPVQIRVMEKESPPVFIVVPGKVYRRDVADSSHLPVFHQIEGLAVDKGITFADLKGTLEFFSHQILGADRKVRFRPSYFPFTEPSAEVDVSCFCEGKGCRVCKGSGWLEILGAGMVDPNVFDEVGYDNEEYTGFAFGLGVERIAMLKYGVSDIRLFFDNDQKFLEQF